MKFSLLSIFVLWILIDCYHGYERKCPDKCECIFRSADCSKQNISEMPSGFSGEVRSLNLKKNKIAMLQNNELVKLKYLQSLNIGFNSLKEIKDNDLNGLSNLKELDLSFNKISEIQNNSFKNLNSITVINLKGNKLKHIEGVFVNMRGLNRLDLSMNRIETLTLDTFKNLTNLRFLLLESNNIKCIHVRAFYDLTGVTFIYLSGNPIGNVNGLFVKNAFLSFIELRNCSLETFPKGLPQFVRFLKLDQNKIRSITRKEVELVESLLHLSLSENNLISIEKEAFANLTHLAELSLNFNFLTDVPKVPVSTKKFHIDNNKINSLMKDDFPLGSELETLSVKNNLIPTINQSTFENLKSLKTLFLGGNKLSVLPDYAFKSMPLLEELDLKGLDVNYIGPQSFDGLSNLRKLTLSFTVLQDGALHGNIFKYLTNLRILDLQESPSIAIKLLDSREMFSSLNKLEQINLMDNDLKTIKPNRMKNMPTLNIIKLDGNQFHCDRRLIWLKNWIIDQKYKFENLDLLVCVSPPELNGSSIIGLKKNQFVPTTLKPEHISTTLYTVPSTQSTNPISNSSNINETFTFEEVIMTDNTATMLNELETTTGYPNGKNYDTYNNNKKKKLYEDKLNKVILITAVTAIPFVLVVVIVTAVVCLKCNVRKETYNQTNSFADNDVTFYVISDEAPAHPHLNSTRNDRESVSSTTRKDRGSVSSTRDITGDNVFTIDNDSS